MPRRRRWRRPLVAAALLLLPHTAGATCGAASLLSVARNFSECLAGANSTLAAAVSCGCPVGAPPPAAAACWAEGAGQLYRASVVERTCGSAPASGSAGNSTNVTSSGTGGSATLTEVADSPTVTLPDAAAACAASLPRFYTCSSENSSATASPSAAPSASPTASPVSGGGSPPSNSTNDTAAPASAEHCGCAAAALALAESIGCSDFVAEAREAAAAEVAAGRSLPPSGASICLCSQRELCPLDLPPADVTVSTPAYQMSLEVSGNTSVADVVDAVQAAVSAALGVQPWQVRVLRIGDVFSAEAAAADGKHVEGSTELYLRVMAIEQAALNTTGQQLLDAVNGTINGTGVSIRPPIREVSDPFAPSTPQPPPPEPPIRTVTKTEKETPAWAIALIVVFAVLAVAGFATAAFTYFRDPSDDDDGDAAPSAPLGQAATAAATAPPTAPTASPASAPAAPPSAPPPAATGPPKPPPPQQFKPKKLPADDAKPES